MTPSRRSLLATVTALGTGAGLWLTAALAAKPAPLAAGWDHTIGRADAPVELIEYASPVCGHCANWQATVWPRIKADFVDTGKVRYVFRELATDPANIAFATLLLARCSGTSEGYFSVIHDVMKGQKAMFSSGDARPVLFGAAEKAGLNEARANACLTDAKALETIQTRMEANASAFDITGTPAFVVNGTLLPRETFDYEAIAAAINTALKAPAKPSDKAKRPLPRPR